MSKNYHAVHYLVTGIGLALAATASAKRYHRHQTETKLNQILDDVKSALRHEGKVVGSWIEENPHLLTQNENTFPIYRGGLICKKADGTHQFRFKVAAKTGMIVEFIKL